MVNGRRSKTSQELTDELSMGWKLTNIMITIMISVIFVRQMMIMTSISEIKQSNAVLEERIKSLPSQELQSRVVSLEDKHGYDSHRHGAKSP